MLEDETVLKTLGVGHFLDQLAYNGNLLDKSIR